MVFRQCGSKVLGHLTQFFMKLSFSYIAWGEGGLRDKQEVMETNLEQRKRYKKPFYSFKVITLISVPTNFVLHCRFTAPVNPIRNELLVLKVCKVIFISSHVLLAWASETKLGGVTGQFSLNHEDKFPETPYDKFLHNL